MPSWSILLSFLKSLYYLYGVAVVGVEALRISLDVEFEDFDRLFGFTVSQ